VSERWRFGSSLMVADDAWLRWMFKVVWTKLLVDKYWWVGGKDSS